MKKKVKKLAKGGQNKPIITNNPKDPRLQAYNDSLAVYNSYLNTKNAVEEEGTYHKAPVLISKGSKLVRNPFEKEVIKRYNNDGTYEVQDTQADMYNTNLPAQLINSRIKPNNIDEYFSHKPYYPLNSPKNIQFKAAGKYLSYLQPNFDIKGIYNYENAQPVQPIIYQSKQEAINPILGGHAFKGSNTAWNGTFKDIRPINQAIQIDNITPNLLPTYQPDNTIETNPFIKGSYFTRPRQSQEAGQGKTDYFDKKTGKLMGTYANGGNINIMKDGGIHINPKNKGKFNATKKKTGKTTEELTHSKNPITKKRAIFAQNAAKWKHEDGGELYDLKAPYLEPYAFGGFKPSGIKAPNMFKGANFQQQQLQAPQINNPSQQWDINKPLQKGNVSIPQVTGAPNFYQPKEVPQINAYDFYDPAQGYYQAPATQQQNQWMDFANQLKPSMENMQNMPKASIPNITNSKWWAKADKHLQEGQRKAIEAGNAIVEGFTGGMKNGGKMAGGGMMSWLNAASYAAGAGADFAAMGMDTTGAILDTFGSMNINNQVKQWENQQKREFAFNKAENLPPIEQSGFNFQGRNNALYATGGQVPSKFTGKRHYEGGETINTNVNFSNANDMKVNRNDAQVEVEEGEYFVPGMETGGKQENHVILSDRKTVGWKGKSPSEHYEDITKAEFGISADKFNKGLTKNEKFRAENIKFLDPKNQENTTKAIDALSTPIVEGMQDIAQNVYIKQEMTKKSKGMDNDLASIMQSNQQPMAQYGAQIPDTDVYPGNEMFMAYGGNLPIAANGDGLDFFSGNQEDVYKYAKSKGYKGKNKIGDLQKWAAKYDPRGVADYTLMAKPSNKAISEYNKLLKEKGLPPVKDSKDVNMSVFSPQERLNIFQDDMWRFRYPKVQEQIAAQANPVAVTKTIPQSDVVNKITPKGGTSGAGFKFNPQGQIPFVPIDTYQRDPITGYTLDPQYVKPRYLDVNPELNAINRDTNAILSLATDRTGAGIANIANVYNQARTAKQNALSGKYRYDQQQDQWAEGTNAQTKMNIDLQNSQNYIQNIRNPQLQREAAITQQKQLDQAPYIKQAADMQHEQRVADMASQIYNPAYVNYMDYVNPSLTKPTGIDETTYKVVNGQYVPVSAKDKKKMGGRLSKFKKKKK